MKRSLLIYLVLAGFGFDAMLAPVRAAERDDASDSLLAEVVNTPDGPRFNLDILSGSFEPKAGVKKRATIGNLIDFLREHTSWNFALAPGAAEVTVQELRLRSATGEDFLAALPVATDNQVQPRKTGAQLYAILSRGASDLKLEVFNLSAYIDHALAANAAKRIKAAKAQIKDTGPEEIQQHLDKAQQQELLTIMAGVEHILADTLSFADVKEPDRQMGVRFHQDARLLVVRATPKAIEIVRKVVTALNEPYQKGRSDLLMDIPVP